MSKSRGNKTYPKQVTVYMTADELAETERRLGKSKRFSSRSRLIVRSAVEGAVMDIDMGEHGDAQTVRALREIKGEIEALADEINRAGINLNEVLAKLESQREYEIVPAQELRFAADQVAAALEVVIADAGAVREEIDQAKAEAEKRKRKSIEMAQKQAQLPSDHPRSPTPQS